MIIPGSHRSAAYRREVDSTTTSYPIRALDNETVDALARERGIVAPQGPPGSAIFAHTNCVHASGPEHESLGSGGDLAHPQLDREPAHGVAAPGMGGNGRLPASRRARVLNA